MTDITHLTHLGSQSTGYQYEAPNAALLEPVPSAHFLQRVGED